MLSIIIPVYNTAAYLRKCLDSVSLTKTDVEIICINDCSTDESLSILEEYAGKDERIKVICNKKNTGPSGARNVGLDAALGEYIAFVDSDDYVEPGCFDIALARMLENNVDIVFFGINILANRSKLKLYSKYYELKFNGQKNTDEKNTAFNAVIVWNKIYKKSIIDDYNLRFPPGMIYEDIVFYWQYVTFTRSAYFEPQKLYNHVLRCNSIMEDTFSGKNSANYWDFLRAFTLVFDFWRENNMLDEKRNLISILFKRCFHNAFTFAKDKRQCFDESVKLVQTLNLYELCPDSEIIKFLHHKKQYYLIKNVKLFYLIKRRIFNFFLRFL
jgi:glycosyltransferase involved in cell wall biosynthesis